MEIILKENVANVGFKDEIVIVKAGYGRNFLIPTGKAVLATESAKKVLAENLKQKENELKPKKKTKKPKVKFCPEGKLGVALCCIVRNLNDRRQKKLAFDFSKGEDKRFE